jgi:hypothetical protein
MAASLAVYDCITMNCWVQGMGTLETDDGDLRERSVDLSAAS